MIYAVSIIEMHDEWFKAVQKGYSEDQRIARIVRALEVQSPEAHTAAEANLPHTARKALGNGHFLLLDKILYYRTGPMSSVVVLGDKASKREMLHACHDAITSGHWGYDKTLETIRRYAYWPEMATDVKVYVDTCKACQLSKRNTGKQAGFLMKIDTPKRPWDVLHMDFVGALPPAGIDGYNTCLVIVDRCTKRAKFLPTHDTATAKDTALLYWNSCFSDYGVPRIIISDRDPKFTSDFWKRLFKLMGSTLAMSTAHHPQTDGLAERTIQTLVDMIRRYCAFGLVYQDKTGYKHDWVSLLPALEIAYNTSKHSSTERTPFELERGWLPRTPLSLMNQPSSIEIAANPEADSFLKMIDSSRQYASECVDAAFEEHKKRWDGHHVHSKFKTGDQVLLSTRHFGTVGSRKLKDPWVGPFAVTTMVNDNAARLLLTPPYDRKHNVFPVSMLKISAVAEPGSVPDRPQPGRKAFLRLDEDGEPLWEAEKIMDERIIKKDQKTYRQYLIKWVDYDEPTWEPEEKIKAEPELLRRFRHARRAV